jgi:membrane fusion protein
MALKNSKNSELGEPALFRGEVIEARRLSWTGNVSLARPISFRLMTALLCLLATVCALFLFFGEYTRKATVSGYVTTSSGLVKVTSNVSGVISDLNVTEGSVVAKGDLIARINADISTQNGTVQAQTQKQIKLRRDILAMEKSRVLNAYSHEETGLQARADNLRSELVHIGEQISLQKKKIQISQSVFDRYKKLQDSGFLSDLGAKDREKDLINELSSLQVLERSQSSIQSDLATALSEVRRLPIKREKEMRDIAAGTSLLDQENLVAESRGQTILVAPSDGRISGLTADKGRFVATGQSMMTIVPKDSSLVVDLYVPSKSIGFLRIGGDAMLQFQSFPYQKFGALKGTITGISNTPMTAAELTFPAPQGELFYVVSVLPLKETIRVFGRDERIRPGMAVDGRLILEKRLIVEWIFEPLLTVHGRF